MAAAKKKPKAKSRKAPAAKPAKKSTAKKVAPKKATPKKAALKKAAPKKPAVRATAAKPSERATPKTQAAPAHAVRKSATRPAQTPPPAAPARPVPLPGEEPVGIVMHYFNHLSVAVVHLDAGTLKVGDTIRIIGHTSDFRQKIESLQIEHEKVAEVERRQEFGLKVKEHVREHDVVYKVSE